MDSFCGLTVISAVDGIDAVAKFRKHADDIVVFLIDLTVLNMDGIAAMCKSHLINPDIKIIISSGFNYVISTTAETARLQVTVACSASYTPFSDRQSPCRE